MIGKTFDDYTIISPLGKGNMAEVYLAQQNSLQRLVALKILKLHENGSESDDIMGRFMREARIAGAIQHPNIVNIYAIGRLSTFAYIAMEYVEGATIEDTIARKPMLEEEVWEISLQVCDALRTAHYKDIIHRDIKPANILINNHGEAKITDFGLSKKQNDFELTQHGLILGTPSYMSVEQASGESVDFRSDIYSLGATIYRMVTGKLLFYANTVIEVLYKHKYEKTVDPVEYIPELSYKNSFIIAKMVQKKPEDRYQSYDEIICDIHCLLEDKPLVYATEKDAMCIYFEKRMETETFSRTSRITKKIVGNIKNIIEREENALANSSKTLLSSTQKKFYCDDPNKKLEETSRRKETSYLSSETNIRDTLNMRVSTQKIRAMKRRKRAVVNLEKNIRTLEEKLGKSFCQHLIDVGILQKQQLESAVNVYMAVNAKFGDIATNEGLLLPEQVEKVLKVQARIKKCFGEIAIQMGFLSKKQVIEILDCQDRNHIDFYEVLIRESLVNKKILEEELVNFTIGY